MSLFGKSSWDPGRVKLRDSQADQSGETGAHQSQMSNCIHQQRLLVVLHAVFVRLYCFSGFCHLVTNNPWTDCALVAEHVMSLLLVGVIQQQQQQQQDGLLQVRMQCLLCPAKVCCRSVAALVK